MLAKISRSSLFFGWGMGEGLVRVFSCTLVLLVLLVLPPD